MKAFLIDPVAREISEVYYSGDWRQIAPQIGAELFDVVYLNAEEDAVFVDEEGLFKPDQRFFTLLGHNPVSLAGRGLVLGTDEEGETVEPKLSLEALQKIVTWGRLL